MLSRFWRWLVGPSDYEVWIMQQLKKERGGTYKPCYPQDCDPHCPGETADGVVADDKE